MLGQIFCFVLGSLPRILTIWYGQSLKFLQLGKLQFISVAISNDLLKYTKESAKTLNYVQRIIQTIKVSTGFSISQNVLTETF